MLEVTFDIIWEIYGQLKNYKEAYHTYIREVDTLSEHVAVDRSLKGKVVTLNTRQVVVWSYLRVEQCEDLG